MDYIVRIADEEYGPVDDLTLVKWVVEDRINRDTEISSKLIKNWKKASELEFLKPALAEQHQRFLEQGIGGYQEKKESVWSRIKILIWGKFEERPFAMSYKPDFATLSARLNALFFDLTILGFVFIVFAGIGLLGAYKFAAANTGDSALATGDNLILSAEKAAELNERKKEQDSSQDATAKNSDEVAESEIDDNRELIKGAVKNLVDKAEAMSEKMFGKLNKELKAVKEKGEGANLKSINSPSIWADSKAGYKIGFIWVNTADNNRRYVCLDAAEERAKWIEVAKLGRYITLSIIAWLAVFMLYYGLSLGYFAQSPGMWYFGLFICNRDQKETYFFRAFCFTVMMLMLGLMMPLFVLICKRGAHDLLCGVYVYSVVAKSPE